MVNRSWPSTLSSRIISNSSSANGRQFPPSISGVVSILNSSAETRKTNLTPPSDRVSAKINWLFHSPRPAAEEELADGLSPTDADRKTGSLPPPRKAREAGRKRGKGTTTFPKAPPLDEPLAVFSSVFTIKIGSLFPPNSSAFACQKKKDRAALKQNASLFLNLFLQIFLEGF